MLSTTGTHDLRLCLLTYVVCAPILVLVVVIAYAVDPERAGLIIFATWGSMMAASLVIGIVATCVAIYKMDLDSEREPPRRDLEAALPDSVREELYPRHEQLPEGSFYMLMHDM